MPPRSRSRLPTEHQRALAQLGENTQRTVLQSYDNMRSAGLSNADMTDALTPMLHAAALEARGMSAAEIARLVAADLGGGIADYLGGDLGDGDSTATQKALRTVLLSQQAESTGTDTDTGTAAALRKADESDQTEEIRRERLSRLAAAIPMQAGQEQTSRSMRDTPEVTGWVRVIESDACELCQWLYRGGQVYSKERSLTTHPGCECSARPVTDRDR